MCECKLQPIADQDTKRKMFAHTCKPQYFKMINYRRLFVLILLCLSFSADAKKVESTITIANTGPQDVFLMPVVITADANYNYFSNDSLIKLFAHLAVAMVKQDLYAFIEDYLMQQEFKVDTLQRRNYESTSGSCSIIQRDRHGVHYYLLAYKNESIRFLEQFIRQKK